MALTRRPRRVAGVELVSESRLSPPLAHPGPWSQALRPRWADVLFRFGCQAAGEHGDWGTRSRRDAATGATGENMAHLARHGRHGRHGRPTAVVFQRAASCINMVERAQMQTRQIAKVSVGTGAAADMVADQQIISTALQGLASSSLPRSRITTVGYASRAAIVVDYFGCSAGSEGRLPPSLIVAGWGWPLRQRHLQEPLDSPTRRGPTSSEHGSARQGGGIESVHASASIDYMARQRDGWAANASPCVPL